jgi:hypothetical protein
MKENEKEIYNKNLIIYSAIVREKIRDKDKILDCIKLLEYFEDYEKCNHLLNIIKEMGDPTII